MSIEKMFNCIKNTLALLILAGALFGQYGAQAASEDTFDVLQIGTKVYTNVTITTKAKDYIFILHANGMTSIKTAQLPPELLEKLGYAQAEKSKEVATNGAAAWAKAEVAKLETDKLKQMHQQIAEKWQANKSAGKPALATAFSMVPKQAALLFLGVMFALYFFWCFCLMRICQKVGEEPTALVWLPVLQMIPMLRAAGMSLIWIIPWLIPSLNIIPYIVWSLKIAQARRKGIFVGLLLILPITSPFALMYLAFSSAEDGGDDDGHEPEIMSLQTA